MHVRAAPTRVPYECVAFSSLHDFAAASLFDSSGDRRVLGVALFVEPCVA